MMAAKSPLIEPPITSARRPFAMPKKSKNLAALLSYFKSRGGFLYCARNPWRNAMALSMLDKSTDRADRSAWPPAIAAEFEREKQSHNGCVGNALVSESDRVRVWTIRLAPGERIGFHRHVLDYFWTSVSGGRGRQHLMDGTTVEYTYKPGETRHETYGPGQFKVHDLENLGDKEMVFMTIEFLQSANKPLAIPEKVRAAA
jgi:quercetin dioxygenase-like cupin family protein